MTPWSHWLSRISGHAAAWQPGFQQLHFAMHTGIFERGKHAPLAQMIHDAGVAWHQNARIDATRKLKSLIVVEDSPQNRRDYEDLVVKTFFLFGDFPR